jgi:LPS-assembly protein
MKIKRRENKAIAVFGWLCFFPLLFITPTLTAQVKKTTTEKPPLTKPSPLQAVKAPSVDSTKKIVKTGTDTTSLGETVVITDTLNVPTSKDSLDAPIIYEAADSGILNIQESKFYLYGKASTKYQDMNLTASVIEMDNEKSLAKAYFTKDSTGKVLERPKLVQDDMETESDSMFINMKTKKGLTKSTYTKQGEIFVHGDIIKKFEDYFYAYRTTFTTCNLDTPHFAFRAKRVKMVNKKWAYSGLVHPEFEGVPLPIGLPFGIFPLSQGRHSGLLAPQFATTQSFGLGLEGLGYYKVLNEHFDATLRTNIYSYGGFTINLASSYRTRYKYQGSIRLDFQNTKINFKGDPDFQKTRTFNFGWSHSMDSKKRPGTSFSANVNFGSTKFNRLVPNNSQLNFQNNISSSIQYSKTSNDGKTNLSVTANHSQNNQTGQYNVNLPTLSYTVNTLYPFQNEESVGTPKWWQKLGIGYNGQIMNQFSFFDRDSAPRLKYTLGEIIDTMQWGAQHNIPITLSLPSLGPFQISPGISYQERWYGQQINREWTGKKIDTTVKKGFYSAREMSFSLSAATAIFGTVNFKNKNSKIQALRHVIRPTIGASYKPDMAGSSYYTTQIDSTGERYQFSRYEGSVIGAFSPGKFGGLNFGLQNNLEMKVKDKNDTTGTGSRKVKLIDNLSINSSYNLMADSFALSPFSILLSTTLFEKMNITATTTLDPYQVNNRGRRIDKYMWEGGKFALGRITQGSLSFGTNFQSKKKEDDKKGTDAIPEEQQNFITPEEQQQELNYIRNNPSEFADFNIPWSLNLSYSLSFSRQFKPDYSGFQTVIFSSVNANGDFNFAPKWKMGGSAYYDLNTWKLGSLTMFLSREMHCWQMSINITPVGIYRSFNISISPKSGILRDLKVNRTRSFYQ